MKSLAITLMLIGFVVRVFGAEVRGEAAQPVGNSSSNSTSILQSPDWFTDLDAARIAAGKGNYPILIVFVGSDWCPYCKVLDQTVLTTPDWRAYAKGRLVQVTIDVPRDRTRLPMNVMEKNENLVRKLGVLGFPTMIVLDADGTNQLGKFTMSRGMNTYGFMRSVGTALRNRPCEIKRIQELLGKEQAVQYTNLLAQVSDADGQFQSWLSKNPQSTEENQKIFDGFNTQVGSLRAQIEDMEQNVAVRQLESTDAAGVWPLLQRSREYSRQLQTMEAARSDLEAWLLSRPATNSADRQTYQELTERLKQATRNVERVK